MRELLVVKTTPVYGASKTSATVDTATSPEMLAEGAIGIYYIKKSNGVPTLVLGDGTPSLTTAISDTGLPVSKIPFMYAIGTATSCEITDNVSSENILSLIGKEYAAEVKQSWYVGYNGVTGNIVIPTIATYDEAGIDVTVRRMGTNVEDDYALCNASLTVGDGIFDVASKICDAVNVAKVNPKVLAEVSVPTYTGAVGAGITGVVLIKGSNQFTVTGTIGSLALNDYITFSMTPLTNIVNTTAPTGLTGSTYKITAISSLTVTIDRNYSGESQTFATTTGFVRTVTVPTSVGVRVTSLDALSAIDISTYGVIAPATIRTAGNTQSLGSGTPFLMKRLEDNMFIEAGNYQTLDATVPKAVSKLVSTAGYDLYQMTFKKGTGLDARIIENDVYFAFEQGVSGANGSGASFLAIISLIAGVSSTTVAQVVPSLKGTVAANS